MRSEKIMPGLILVLLGALFLLNNFNIIDFRWSNLWHLWPVFLIMAGVNLVFANNRSAWATILKISVVIIGFGLILFSHFDNHRFFPRHDYYLNFDGDDDDDDDNNGNRITKLEGSSVFTERMDSVVTAAKLDISGGGTKYTLQDTTSDLFKADTKEFFSRYIYNKTMDGTMPVLSLHMKKTGKGNFQWDSEKGNSANIMLNTKPEWDINVNAGATELNFDLEKFKVRSLVLNGGAGSFDIKLGQPLAKTTVDVSTGVSEIKIKVPQTAACQISTSSGLSSNNFAGFDKVKDNIYQTPGFDKATNKIYVVMKGGLSDFSVSRY
ncbi:hypothetical protein FPZ43_15000 [Mucilaginibacter pallidiroseus]|uniref:LiaI-LiaF-like transmembrane region domain-containing protein n=1 Tax=Mucilaginibacter pallidiroseus TaxID=2599295 RepID=A0A563U562_9SPHI|nr:DUF5668 domain-containing protein [Mucilaginibacter pallidiroseus]TWR26465.1 hypothetical protein FPZ43_15000 [Mucilaginibacter pallidiroseus]